MWVIGPIRWFALGARSGQTAGHEPGTPCLRRRDGRGDLVPSPGPRRVGVRVSRRPPPPAVPARGVRGPDPPGWGHPSVPCEVVASVLVLQALEGLSDREAVSA